MKRIKSINGYSIYQATSKRDEENYRCNIGNYNIYFSSDIRDYGLSYSDANWEDIDSLEVAIELCGDNYARAKEIVESMYTSATAEEIEAVEKNLDAQEQKHDIINLDEGYSIHFTEDGRVEFGTNEFTGEYVTVEIENYTGMNIVWDVYGETYVYEDGSEIDFAVKRNDGLKVDDYKLTKTLKSFYLETYPEDDLGESMRDLATFADLCYWLINELDVYDLIGVADSIVRERLFQYLSTILYTSYDVIYDAWMGNISTFYGVLSAK